MTVRILVGDCRDVLSTLPNESVQTVCTSPPYFNLRDYGLAGQIGLEPTPDAYVAELVAVFHEVRRVLHPGGTVWLNLGDGYAGSALNPNTGFDGRMGRVVGRKRLERAKIKVRPVVPHGLKPKDLMMIPARVALALQSDGWFLRSEIIWAKPSPMPVSVRDRPTCAHEKVFLLAKSLRYFYDAESVKEPVVTPPRTRRQPGQNKPEGFKGRRSVDLNQKAFTRNLRNVWSIPTEPFAESHFAAMPPALAERCILAGSRPGDTVLDPFAGAGTTGLVADRLGRNAVLIELNPEYAAIGRNRIQGDAPLFAEVA